MKLHSRVEVTQQAQADLTLRSIKLLQEVASHYEWAFVIESALAVELRCAQNGIFGDLEGTPLWGSEIGFTQRLWNMVERVKDEYGLTWLETLRCVHGIALSWINYSLRAERHPGQPGKKADEA